VPSVLQTYEKKPGATFGMKQVTLRPVLPRNEPGLTLLAETMDGLKASVNWNAPSSVMLAAVTLTVVSDPR
jgi:hypothetical protein